jgi:hypothetical protein
MPPPDAVKEGKVKPLSDEDRRTLVRWVDLGCPVDKVFDVAKPDDRGSGWMFDDQRPTLALTYPERGANAKLDRIVVGMHDYNTGLDPGSFEVTADFPINGIAAGENLAPKFKELADGRWELKVTEPIAELAKGQMTVSVKDRQGNTSTINRSFSVTGAR